MGSILRACASADAATAGADADRDGSLGVLGLTHILFDEASQGIEPEALLSMLLAGPDTHVIFSGDPRQLGPSVRSALAQTRGLSISIQERLLKGSMALGAKYAAAREGLAAILDGRVRDLGSRILEAYRDTEPVVVAGAGLDRTACGAARPYSSYALLDDLAACAQHAAAGECADSAIALRLGLLPVQYALSCTLTRNYRSHPALLQLSSHLFYRSTLASLASIADSEACHTWTMLSDKWRAGAHVAATTISPTAAATSVPSKDELPFPVLALGVRGEDGVSPDAPSYYCMAEVEAVSWIVRHLLSESAGSFSAMGASLAPMEMWYAGRVVSHPLPGRPVTMSLTQSDIGVITPYRQQTQRVREALRAVGLSGISVGNVSNFQGGERKVIILTTTLSDTFGPRAIAAANSGGDSNGVTVGLFGEAKPFNVALTRAQSLLICVGNPRIWLMDRYWRSLLQFAVDHGAYLGWREEPCPIEHSAAALFAATSPKGSGSVPSTLAHAGVPVGSDASSTTDATARSASAASAESTMSNFEDALQRLQSLREYDMEGSFRLMA